jgi:hypothetical protein
VSTVVIENAGFEGCARLGGKRQVLLVDITSEGLQMDGRTIGQKWPAGEAELEGSGADNVVAFILRVGVSRVS